MAIVSIRVRPTVNGKLTEGTADSAPYAHLVGRLGHVFERRDLSDAQLSDLRAAGDLFEIVEDHTRARNLVKLVPRIPRGKIMKLGNGGTP